MHISKFLWFFILVIGCKSLNVRNSTSYSKDEHDVSTSIFKLEDKSDNLNYFTQFILKNLVISIFGFMYHQDIF